MRKLWGAMLLLAVVAVEVPWAVAQAPPATIPGVPPGGMVVGPRQVDLAKPLILRDAGLVCEREDQIEAWIAMIRGSGRGFGSSKDCAIVGREMPATLLERKPLAGV